MSYTRNYLHRHPPLAWTVYGPQAFRAAVAEDRRRRDRAERLGLRAIHARTGSWSAVDRETGLTIVESCFGWQLDEALERLARPINRELLGLVRATAKMKAVLERHAECAA